MGTGLWARIVDSSICLLKVCMPRRVLIAKLTSLGDVLFTLPMVSDIRRHRPDLEIDWVIDDTLADLPALHPGVSQIHAIPLRRLKKMPKPERWPALRQAVKSLRQSRYEVVLDCHGMIKSAALSWLAKAELIYGPADERLGERAARWVYDQRIVPDPALPAVQWYRMFAGLALGYQPQGLPDFGLQAVPLRGEWLPAGPYVLGFHAASKAEKCWSVESWQAVGQQLAECGVALILPWGSPAEQGVAQAIAASVPKAVVAPKMTVAELAGAMLGAQQVIGVDTGMTHLAESLGVPTIALYTVTDPATYHPYWNFAAHALGGNGEVPQVEEVLKLLV